MYIVNMNEELKIVKRNSYLDGGTKVFLFSDGLLAYQDFRLGASTSGKFYDSYPGGILSNEMILSESHLKLINEL